MKIEKREKGKQAHTPSADALGVGRCLSFKL